MSIQSTIIRELSKKYQGREKLLTPKSEKRYRRILFIWFILGYVLGCLIDYYNINFSDCALCQSISSYLPSIHKLAVGSLYPEAMHFVWLYFLLSASPVLIVLFINVREFNRRVIKPYWGIVLLIAVALLSTYVCLVGMGFGGEDASDRFSKLYHKYLFYSTLVACSFNVMIVGAVFHLTHHFIGIFNKESAW